MSGQTLLERLRHLEDDVEHLLLVHRRGGLEDHQLKRRGVNLVRELDRFTKDADAYKCADLADRAEKHKTEIGRVIFGINPSELSAVNQAMRRTSVDRELEQAQRNVEGIEKALEQARQRLAEVLARPQDDYEVNTYLVAERKPEMPGYVWGPPRLYHKDEQGRWWSSSQTSSPVGWGVVRKTLEDERLNVYIIESMTEVEH